jgi:hypothetical protein
MAPARAARAATDVATLRARGGGLDAGETAVLALLRRRALETRRGDRLETQLRRSLHHTLRKAA